MSETTVKKHRIQITVQISGLPGNDDRKLKTFIQEFLWKRGLGCCIERIRHSDREDDVTTVVLFEGESGDVYSAKADLIEALKVHHPHVPLPPDTAEHWKVEESKEKLLAAKILPTDTAIRRDNSSGAIMNSKPVILSDSGRSRKSVSIGSITSTVVNAIANALTKAETTRALQLAGIISKIVPRINYKDKCCMIDCTTAIWDTFKEDCKKAFDLKMDVKKIWEYSNGIWIRILDIGILEHDHDYYITIETEPDPTLPKFETMEEFYSALQKEGLDDVDITEVEKIFQDQGIGVKMLHLLNDSDLKEYGLTQGGLRMAVLAVLGK
jgi:hypothetical protein